MAMQSPWGTNPLAGMGNLGSILNQTRNMPSVRTPQSALEQMSAAYRQTSTPSKSGRRLAGQKPTPEFDPASYVSKLGGSNMQDYLNQLQGSASATSKGIQNSASGIANDLQGYQSMTGNASTLTGQRSAGSSSELNSAANTAIQMRDGNRFMQDMQGLFTSRKPAFTQVGGRMVQSSELNASTFRDMSGLEDIRGMQQQSLGGAMNWMKDKDYERDRNALYEQAKVAKDMKGFDRDLEQKKEMDQFNLGAQGINLQQKQIDSDANYARARQLADDAYTREVARERANGTTSTMVNSAYGGGGGGGGYGSSGSDWDPYKMAELGLQGQLGNRQIDASMFATQSNKEASMYGSYLQATQPGMAGRYW